MDEFHIGPYMTAVGDGEMLTEVRIPLRRAPAAPTRRSSAELGTGRSRPPRPAVWIDGGTIADAGLALSAVGPTTVHVTRAEELLRGKRPAEELFAQAGRDRLRGLLAVGRRPRTGRLQAPPRRRAHRARPAPGHRPRARNRRPETAMQVTITINGEPVSRDVEPRSCSCISSATRRGSPAPTGAVTPPTAAPVSC